MPKTTKKHFEIFKKEGRKLVNDLGLLDWDVNYTHGNVDDENNAECAYLISGKSVWLRLTAEWDTEEDLTDQVIKETAWHEVLHVLLAVLDALASNRFVQAREIDVEVHTIVQRLINFIRLKEGRVKK